jgi:hypothetical protein
MLPPRSTATPLWWPAILENRIFAIVMIFVVYIVQALHISHHNGYNSISAYIENYKNVTTCAFFLMSFLWILNEMEVHEMHRGPRVLVSITYCMSVFFVLQYDVSTHTAEHNASVFVLATSMLLYQIICVDMCKRLFGKSRRGVLETIFLFNVAVSCILTAKFITGGKIFLLEMAFILGSGLFTSQRDHMCAGLLPKDDQEPGRVAEIWRIYPPRQENGVRRLGDSSYCC